MNQSPANPGRLADATLAGEGWTRTRWLSLIILIFAAHVGFIFLFGERQPVIPRAIANVPSLKLAQHSGDWLALTDPTLFALPHQRDFASAVWLQTPAVKPPSFRWTEAPRWLALAGASLGTAYTQFMQTNIFARQPLDFKPAPQLRLPAWLGPPMPAHNSTLKIMGDLARRAPASAISLTNWPYANVIAPSVVQVLVDPAGSVISTVLLPPGSSFAPADQYDAADQRALELARNLRFQPAPQLAVGRIVFNWHTVPVPPTSEPSR